MNLHHRVRIKETNNFLLGKSKQGKRAVWKLSNGESVYQSDIMNNLECECTSCKKYFKVTLHTYFLRISEYRCFSCLQRGENNAFYGKKHSKETRRKHSEFMKGRFVGEKNHFHGKTHSLETRELLSSKCGRAGSENGFYGKTHTVETKAKLSKSSKKWANANKDKMREMGLRSAQILAKGRKTKIERIVEEKLVEMQIPHRYNKIVQGVGQFDFIIGDDILLEVNGDYWHANPEIYKDKEKLTERQRYKIKRDLEKKTAAEDLGFRLYYIWERDILENNFEVLNEIQISRN